MLTEFIKTVLNYTFDRNIIPTFKFGRFTLVNNTYATVTHAGSEFHADLSLASDFTVAGRNKKVSIQGSYTSYAGYNGKYISEQGVYDPLAALAEFSKSDVEKRMVKEETFAQMCTMTHSDSHEAFIYNMLITWLRAQLNKYNDTEDYNLQVKVSPYRDSHATVPLNGSVDDHTYNIQLGPPVSVDAIQGVDWTLRTKENYFSRPYVLHYNGSNKAAEAFYLIHTQGRTKTSALNFDVPLPPLDARQLLLDPVNRHASVDMALDEVDWDTPETMWDWIMDYVRLNRLEQAFASVFETLGAMAFQPNYSSQEANLWQHAKMVLVLGEFSPTRARVRTNLEGVPFVPHAPTQQFMLSESHMPKQYMMASAMANYYMWLGLYAVLHDHARSRSEWRSVYSSMADGLEILYSPLMRAAMIATVTGHEYASCVTEGAGMYVDISPLTNIKRIGGIVPGADNGRTEIPINYIPAPVSGALVLGAVNGDYDAVAHLTAHQTFTGHGLNYAYELRDALVLSNTMRLYGHHTEYKNHTTGEIIKPWAPVRDCVIEPSSLWFDPDSPAVIAPSYSYIREGRSHTLPNIHHLTARETSFSLLIARPVITSCDWQKRWVPSRPYVQVRTRPKEIKFKVTAPMVHRPVAYRATTTYVKPTPTEAFRVEVTETPAAKPEGVVIPAPMGEQTAGDTVAPVG